VLSEPINARPNERVLRALAEHDGELATCSIVWHELRYGASPLRPSRRRRAIEAYLEEAIPSALPILPYDREAAAWHAGKRARLAKTGRSPAGADGQIAAIARVHELVLVTANGRDFRRFQGLKLADWSRSRHQGRE